jgi:hypothetical protein
MLEVAAAKRLGTLLLFQALLYDFSTFLGYNRFMVSSMNVPVPAPHSLMFDNRNYFKM